MYQILLTCLFAAAMGVLTMAASIAEPPRSELVAPAAVE
jgi:hypothetical protein